MSKMILSNCSSNLSTGCAVFTGSSTSSNSFAQQLMQGSPIPISDLNLISYEQPKYSIFDIANWFLSKESMTHKKLQKLCYYAQAWFYAIKDTCLSDTVFEAWVHGPVSPVLYDKFKSFGYSAIRLVNDYELVIQDDDIQIMESVWETYGDRTGNALEALSHNEPPWIEARIGYSSDERCEVVISADSMKKYYKSIYLGENV